MRLGHWSWLVGLAVTTGACSGGYPLPPTRCDEWCDATKGMVCDEYYQPANCVAQCEQTNITADGCRAELDAEIGCFRATPRAAELFCEYTQERYQNPCAVQIDALSVCVSKLFLQSYGNKG